MMPRSSSVIGVFTSLLREQNEALLRKIVSYDGMPLFLLSVAHLSRLGLVVLASLLLPSDCVEKCSV